MSEHTPGPWYVGSMNDGLFVIDRRPEHSTDSGVRDGGLTLVIAAVAMLKHPIAQANANLLAAAPEMLESLKRGRRKLATYTAIYSGDTELVKLLAMWDDVIAKAEPKSGKAIGGDL